jgi:hypothetical protein
MNGSPMKIAEVRTLLDKYSKKQMHIIITEMYKAIPKKVKVDRGIDGIISDPDAASSSAGRKKCSPEPPSMDELQNEIDLFISDAYSSYYFAPNSVVPKRERLKWRFQVKRWYRDLQSATESGENAARAAELLEKLYVLLCYACEYILFSGDDSFQSVGVEQTVFFRTLLTLKRQQEDITSFVPQAVLLIPDNSVNRDTLPNQLMHIVLEFLPTPDAKLLAVQCCEEAIAGEIKNPTVSSAGWSNSNFKSDERINQLVEIAFLCFNALGEIDKGIEFFHRRYRNNGPEIKLYVLFRFLFDCRQPGCFLREYEKALKEGVSPRKELVDIYRTVGISGEFPERR